MDEIFKLFNENKYDDAKAIIKNKLKNDSNNAEYLYKLFLAENNDYANMDINDIKSEVSFNSALEFAKPEEKQMFEFEYSFFKGLNDTYRKLFCYAIRGNIKALVDVLKNDDLSLDGVDSGSLLQVFSRYKDDEYLFFYVFNAVYIETKDEIIHKELIKIQNSEFMGKYVYEKKQFVITEIEVHFKINNPSKEEKKALDAEFNRCFNLFLKKVEEDGKRQQKEAKKKKAQGPAERGKKKRLLLISFISSIACLIATVLVLVFVVFIPMANERARQEQERQIQEQERINQEYYDKAINLINTEYYEDAVNVLENMDYSDSSNQLNVARAGVSLKSGNYDEAIRQMCNASGVTNVTYDARGGSATVTDESITSYKSISNTCVKDYYDFTGWKLENYKIVAKKNSYLCELKFIAEYTLTNYDITYDLNGGVNDATNPTTITHDDSIILASPEKEGYSFIGWEIDGVATSDLTLSNVSHNVKLKALWEANKYTYTLDLNGGTGSDYGDKEITYGELNTFAEPTKDGYTFKGWRYGSRILGTNYDIPNDVTLTAKWELIQYDVTYVLDGGTNSTSNPKSVSQFTTFTLSAPTKKGYTFLGWSKNSNGDDYQLEYTISEVKNDLTLYAIWNVNTYTLKYNVDSGSLANIEESYDYGTSITLKTPTKEGCTFLGWSIDGKKIQSPYVMSDSDVVLEPLWDYSCLSYLEYKETSSNSIQITGMKSGFSEVELILPSEIDGKKVTSIKESALSNANLYNVQKLYVPTSVTEIGEAAFAGMQSLKSITLPFVGPKQCAYADSNYSYNFGYIFGSTSYTGSKLVSTQIYTAYTESINYYIPSQLTEVTILGGEAIQKYAFYNYSQLTKITLPSTVTEIGDSAFYGCSGLTSFTVPKNITSIDSDVFDGCTGLDTVYYNNTIENWCKIALGNDKSNPMCCANNFKLNNENIINLVVPSTITKIGAYQFININTIETVYVPTSVTEIGKDVFSGCSGIKSITLPFVGPEQCAYANSSYSYNFGYIFGSTSYTGSKLVSTQIYTTYTFSLNYYIPSQLTEVTILGGEAIQKNAFYNYSQLTKITLPSTITEIGSYAFYDCNPNLVIYYEGSQSDWNSITISSGNDLLSTVNIVYNS